MKYYIIFRRGHIEPAAAFERVGYYSCKLLEVLVLALHTGHAMRAAAHTAFHFLYKCCKNNKDMMKRGASVNMLPNILPHI